VKVSEEERGQAVAAIKDNSYSLKHEQL